MNAQVHPVGAGQEELNLYPQWRSREAASRAWRAKAVSAGLHVAAVLVLFFTPLGHTPVHDMSRIVAQFREPVVLTLPPRELTQTAPNRGKIGKEFDLESLLSRPRVFVPPSLPAAAPPYERPVPLPEPPKIETAQQEAAPLPQIQPVERPKLALESPRGASAAEAAKSRPAPSSSSTAEMGRALARGRGTAPLIVNDGGAGPGDVEPGVDLRPSPAASGNSLELLSDPRGVDFKPYLVQILAAVKRNWQAVMPASVKLGQRGRVAIQFAINRDGTVQNLAIASPSGLQALDLAAVAGIGATNPFPPLPAEYRGETIRLQFVFLYNMRAN